VTRAITILLVDDDVDFRALLHDAILHVWPSARVWEVGGGCEAMDFLRQRGRHTTAPPVDMVFTDLEMPDMSGQELLKALACDTDLKHIPIVMLTGLCDEQQREQAIANGARVYAVKPADHAELCRIADRSIRGIAGAIERETGGVSGEAQCAKQSK